MLSKELEILKHIAELYKGDVTDEDFVLEMQDKENLVKMWSDAFDGYLLRDVLDAIDEYFTFKNNKSAPRIQQILAMLNSKNIHRETEDVIPEKKEKVELPFWLKYQQQDRETGDMSWLVPHYQIVGRLIEQDYFPWVQNIYNPSYEDFRAAMKQWSVETYGREYFVESDNQFNALPPEVQKAKYEHAREVLRNFSLKGLN